MFLCSSFPIILNIQIFPRIPCWKGINIATEMLHKRNILGFICCWRGFTGNSTADACITSVTILWILKYYKSRLLIFLLIVFDDNPKM